MCCYPPLLRMCLVLCCILLSLDPITSRDVDFLMSYETFTPDLAEESASARRARKSLVEKVENVEDMSYLYTFRTFGQLFTLLLERQDMFGEKPILSIYESRGEDVERELEVDRYFKGKLIDDINSTAHGILDNGVFDGVVSSLILNDTFYIEPAYHYPQIKTNQSQLVYRFSDLDFKEHSNLRRKAAGVHRRVSLSSDTSNRGARSERGRRHVNDQGIKMDRLVEQKELEAMHCPLHVYVDHRYYEQVGMSSPKGTIDEVIYHIGEADRIFRSTSFDGKGTSNNIGFIIAKITLFKTRSANPIADIMSGDDSQTFLNRFSTLDHSKYCLGVMFTVVDFAQGVLGLAWIADPDSLGAGICSVAHTFHNGSTMYYNSAIITNVNYGKMIPRPMFSITVTHELGHSFGAEHDDASRYTCAPGGSDGNYVMFHLSGDALKPNHERFSPCSINYIYKVLSVRMQTHSSVCFLKKYIPFCGNTVIDDREECDCGGTTSCESESSLDSCCNVYSANSSNQCTLKPTSRCSAMASRCCSAETCDYIPASEMKLCSNSSECAQWSYCDGRSADCPEAVNLADGTLCHDNLKVCLSGRCSQTICEYQGYRDCYCTDEKYHCKICCSNGTTGECRPASHLGILDETEDSIPVNGLCQNGLGVCDEERLCRQLDGRYSKSDIARLFKDTASETLELLANHWYYAILAVMGVTFLVILFVFIHKKGKPVQSMAYKDGRMAYVWFEARLRLQKIEKELELLEDYEAPQTLPYPVAMRRMSYQFPSASQSVLSRYILQCNKEVEVVKLLILSGYPMKMLLAEEGENKGKPSMESSLSQIKEDNIT